ncbi:MAG: DEAD/DEAH box helicase [Opitutaceae bacterium]
MDGFGALEVNLKIPDLWQQDAVRALNQGFDVVVDAPTGAGKTYIFELMVEQGLRRQAVFTVPTRALANDKLIEWRSRGWNVGIATGDVAENLSAPVVVATLETQRSRFLQRDGPGLLVIDEYQMLADSVRGVSYELAVALVPAETQLLLLSGSVGNPEDVVGWLNRIGRKAVLVSHRERPVPLDEVHLDSLHERVPDWVRGFWPRLIARGLMADLGPILVFAPQRKAAENLARHLAAALPVTDPLILSREQKLLAGERMEKLLRSRIAFHHSGLGYHQRAGVLEPLAKAGQLRVVVATTGLAAGINFSMRSVLVTEVEYTAGHLQCLIRPDELLQMFGRAGRRGLDEIGYVLVAPDRPRLADARRLVVRRPATLEWPSLLAVMKSAAVQGRDPFPAARELAGRLYTENVPLLGMEHSVETGPMPCGLRIDAHRARHARPLVVEMLDSKGVWVERPEPEPVELRNVLRRVGDRWRPALGDPTTLDGIGHGTLCRLESGRGRAYGRQLTVAVRVAGQEGLFRLSRPVLRALAPDESGTPRTVGTPPRRREAPEADVRQIVLNVIATLSGGGQLFDLVEHSGQLVARVGYGHIRVTAYRDPHECGLIDPPDRKAYPIECQHCLERPVCEHELNPRSSPASAWKRLGLIDSAGHPTRRGEIFSYFHHGEGLAVAAALEDPDYPIDEIISHLANLRAGHRFEDHARTSSRLARACRDRYGEASFEGYLHRGLPIHYGDGAAEVLAEIAAGAGRGLFSDVLRPGDVERARLEWFSLLRHTVHAPDLAWDRWRSLKAAATRLIDLSGTTLEVIHPPPLTPAQTGRVSHRLRFR